ncbi:hypothetical protein cypCar_00019708, partial [Cyprinus carpio]
QEGLAEISQSSASEQVSYLLVERVTLLERLEAAERKLDTQTLTRNLREVHLQEELDHMRHTTEEELRQQKENMNEGFGNNVNPDPSLDTEDEILHKSLARAFKKHLRSSWVDLMKKKVGGNSWRWICLYPRLLSKQKKRLKEKKEFWKKIHVKQQLQYAREQIPRASQEEERQLALQAQISEAQARAKAQDSLLQQKGEENKQLRQDLQRTQHLFTSAERELRYEREKNLDLKRHNALLDQEKIKLGNLMVLLLTAVCGAEQVVELKRLQQRVRDLEPEVARSTQNRKTNSSLMEELNSERARVIAADKKVVELQQQLKNALHQLRLEEARAGETSKLERDTRDMSDNLSALRAQLQEEQLQRKLLQQKDEELQQQVHSLQAKEATLTRTNSEMSHRTQELESELNTAREEEKDWIRTVTEENDQLLLERRELLQRISEAEEMGNNGLRTATLS